MKYKSNGKILLTSEYLVLDGALALALPSKLSQNLEVKYTENKNEINWISYDFNGEIWFSECFVLSKDKFSYKNKKNKYSDKLISIFNGIEKLNEGVFSNLGAEFTTRLEFSKNWGLGSSSTLINNLSMWAKIDPYDLLDLTFKGSGYDIACCNKINPITYVKNKNGRIIKDVDFNPSFKENLFFIYLGHKQNTSEAIENYRSMSNDINNVIKKINSINLSIMKSNTLNEYIIQLFEKVGETPPQLLGSVQSPTLPPPVHVKSGTSSATVMLSIAMSEVKLLPVVPQNSKTT